MNPASVLACSRAEWDLMCTSCEHSYCCAFHNKQTLLWLAVLHASNPGAGRLQRQQDRATGCPVASSSELRRDPDWHVADRQVRPKVVALMQTC